MVSRAKDFLYDDFNNISKPESDFESFTYIIEGSSLTESNIADFMKENL